MKNRRTIVMAFLLCACLIVGMGYAAVTDTLTIGGTANISADQADIDFDADVYFSKATDVMSGTNVKLGTATIGNATATATDNGVNDHIAFTIDNSGDNAGFAVVNNTATFTVTVKNDGTADATMEFANTTVPTGFSVEVKAADDANTTNKVAAGSTADFVVTITITATPDADVEATFVITATATAATN